MTPIMKYTHALVILVHQCRALGKLLGRDTAFEYGVLMEEFDRAINSENRRQGK